MADCNNAYELYMNIKQALTMVTGICIWSMIYVKFYMIYGEHNLWLVYGDCVYDICHLIYVITE